MFQTNKLPKSLGALLDTRLVASLAAGKESESISISWQTGLGLSVAGATSAGNNGHVIGMHLKGVIAYAVLSHLSSMESTVRHPGSAVFGKRDPGGGTEGGILERRSRELLHYTLSSK